MLSDASSTLAISTIDNKSGVRPRFLLVYNEGVGSRTRGASEDCREALARLPKGNRRQVSCKSSPTEVGWNLLPISTIKIKNRPQGLFFISVMWDESRTRGASEDCREALARLPKGNRRQVSCKSSPTEVGWNLLPISTIEIKNRPLGLFFISVMWDESRTRGASEIISRQICAGLSAMQIRTAKGAKRLEERAKRTFISTIDNKSGVRPRFLLVYNEGVESRTRGASE
ncbi:hypothetical protein M2140_001550 [Clostridiales Family XIII bacterium PM5-7]